MIGGKTIVIDQTEFLKGMTSSVATLDGGFSPETDNINPLITQGLIYIPDTPADKSTNLSGNIIASCSDPAIASESSGGNPAGNTKYFVTDTGKFYMWDDATLTHTVRTDGAKSYKAGTTDIIAYQGLDSSPKVYATSTNDITLWTVDSALNETWGSSTNSQTLQAGVRHPMIVFNKILHIADKNKIHTWDGTTFIKAVLTLAQEQTITALGIDPGSGRMLVAASEGLNYGNTLFNSAYVGFWDGLNPTQFIRKVFVDDQVNHFYNVGGNIFITYGLNLGYFTGNGIKFLRRFRNVTLSGSELGYKHHVTNLDRFLIVVDGHQVLVFGEIIKDAPAFFYLFSNAPGGTSRKLDHICNLGSGKLGIAYHVSSTPSFVSVDTTSVAGSNAMSFYSKVYFFGRPIEVKEVKVIYGTDIATGITPANISYIDEKGLPSTAIAIKNNNAGNERVIMAPNLIARCETLQLRYNSNTTNPGLKAIVITYDVIE